MLVGHKKQIMKGTPAKYLGLYLPRPEEGPPTPWWTNECDHSLVVGIFKHGQQNTVNLMYYCIMFSCHSVYNRFTLGFSCFGSNASHMEERLIFGTIISIVQ